MKGRNGVNMSLFKILKFQLQTTGFIRKGISSSFLAKMVLANYSEVAIRVLYF